MRLFAVFLVVTMFYSNVFSLDISQKTRLSSFINEAIPITAAYISSDEASHSITIKNSVDNSYTKSGSSVTFR